MARSGDERRLGGYEVSLTPIYDDLLREFEGIILVSAAAEAVQTAAPTAEQADEPTPDEV